MSNWIRIGNCLYNRDSKELIPCRYPWMSFCIEGIKVMATEENYNRKFECILYENLKHIDTRIAYLLYSDNDSL